jgi:hypothetical protein
MSSLKRVWRTDDVDVHGAIICIANCLTFREGYVWLQPPASQLTGIYSGVDSFIHRQCVLLLPAQRKAAADFLGNRNGREGGR